MCNGKREGLGDREGAGTLWLNERGGVTEKRVEGRKREIDI